MFKVVEDRMTRVHSLEQSFHRSGHFMTAECAPDLLQGGNEFNADMNIFFDCGCIGLPMESKEFLIWQGYVYLTHSIGRADIAS